MNRIVINADTGHHKISRHIYGHFSEHLGTCIYGGYWVTDESSLAHTRGIRNDVVQALRATNIPNLRWPGGCFADEYHWMDGIGPRASRPYMVNTHWGGVTENNHFGTHEFLDLCEQLGCEPYICGNLGSGTVHEMQQWVEYITFDGRSPMADLRRQNGREAPWRVKYWGVGNENWGCGGHMSAEYYADEYRRYATYLRNFGENRLYKIAGGAHDDDYHWTEVLMSRLKTPGNQWLAEGISLHYYTFGGGWNNKFPATGFGEEQWFPILRDALVMDELLTRHSTLMDKYDPKREIGLVVDEWGTWYQVEAGTNPGFLYQQNSLRDALVAAIHLNIFNRHCERVHMANIAQTVNVLQAMILTEPDGADGGGRMVLTPTYHVFEMFKVHQDATLLPLDIQCDAYEFGGASLPSVSASASRDAAGVVHVTLANLNPNAAVALACDLRGAAGKRIIGRVLTADAMDAHNTFEQPDAVRPQPFMGAARTDGGFTLELPAKSVVVLAID